MTIQSTVTSCVSSCVHPVNGLSGEEAYYFNFAGGSDSVSKTALPAANYEDAHSVLTGTSIVTTTKDQYVRDAQGRILTFGAYVQLCTRSEQPSFWSVLYAGSVATDTGIDIGPFNVAEINSNGFAHHRVVLWDSGISGLPKGTQYINIYYDNGTSNGIYLSFQDVTAATTTIYSGTIGAAAVSLLSGGAGTLTILSDTVVSSLGARVLTATMSWNVLTNATRIGLGPNSATVGHTIKALGADVFGTSAAGNITTWRPHVPSSGTTVPVSATKYDYNGGSPRGPRFTLTDIPKAVTGLQGPGPGDASGQLEWTGTPLYSASDIAADQNIVVCNETAPMLNFDATGVEVKDGANTSKATLAFTKDTALTVKAPYGPNPVTTQMKIIAGSATSALGDNDGNFNPGTYLGIGGSDFPVAHTSFKIKKAPTW